MTVLALRHAAAIRPLPRWRIAAAVLIVGVSLAGAIVLQHHRFVEDASPLPLTVRVLRVVHPWWLYAATVALVVLGVAGARSALVKTRRSLVTGYMAVSGLFIAAAVGVFADTRLFGRVSTGIVFLLLGVVAAALAGALWPRKSRPSREQRLDAPG
jgi:hypothetical protein